MSNSENRFPGRSSEVAHKPIMKPGWGQCREERACPSRRLCVQRFRDMGGTSSGSRSHSLCWRMEGCVWKRCQKSGEAQQRTQREARRKTNGHHVEELWYQVLDIWIVWVSGVGFNVFGIEIWWMIMDQRSKFYFGVLLQSYWGLSTLEYGESVSD